MELGSSGEYQDELQSELNYSDLEELSMEKYPVPVSHAEWEVYDGKTLLQAMDSLLRETASVMVVPVEVAAALLRAGKWDARSVTEDFVDAPGRALESAGISGSAFEPAPEDTELDEFEDPITLDVVPWKETMRLSCGHRFARSCLQQYVSSSLTTCTPTAFIDLRCLFPDCGYPLQQSLLELMPFEKRDRLDDYTLESFISLSPHLRWCPQGRCRMIVKVEAEQSPCGKMVECTCGKKFCFFCDEGCHQPVECRVARMWNIKNASEADNVTWILVNTKCCPGCRNPIEKNQGCMHMTCRCGYEFCWLCLRKWGTEHSGSYSCNVYDQQTESKVLNPSMQKAKMFLERYTHFFERYSAHNVGQRMAVERQQPQVQQHMREIEMRWPELGTAEWLDAAVTQIIECRRCIKWTYAFGFFADWTAMPAAKSLFEDQQSQLESTLDLLQELTENLKPSSFTETQKIAQYKSRLINLTGVVREFFDRMSTAFQNEFREVVLRDEKGLTYRERLLLDQK